MADAADDGAGSPRTATPAEVMPWLLEAARTAPSLLRTFGVPRVLNPRVRERAAVAVAAADRAALIVWFHDGWRRFLGDRPPSAADEAAIGHARACAAAGHPLDTASLDALLPPAAIQALRHTVARVHLESLVANAFDDVVARLAGSRPLEGVPLVTGATAVAAGAPSLVGAVVAGLVFRTLDRAAPAVPAADLVDAEPNLLSLMLAQALPIYASSAAARLALRALPVPVGLAIKAGPMAATVTVGRGRVRVANDVTPTALAVVEGEVESLLAIATGKVLEGITELRVRRP